MEKANYFYQVSKRSSGEILLEGTCHGTSKSHCQNIAHTMALQKGYKIYSDNDLRLFLRPLTEEEKKAHNPVKEVMSRYGLNMKKLSERFCIPYRTVQNWVGGQRECPSYIIRMMNEILSKED